MCSEGYDAVMPASAGGPAVAAPVAAPPAAAAAAPAHDDASARYSHVVTRIVADDVVLTVLRICM